MFRAILLAVGLLGLVTPAMAVAKRQAYPLCADEKLRSCIENGNTFWYGGEQVRLRNVDAPEPAAPACPAEASAEAAATERLRTLLNSGEVYVFRYGGDAGGRTLVEVISQGREVGETLIAEGLAQPNSSAKGPWCG